MIEKFLKEFGITMALPVERVGRSFFVVRDKDLLSKMPVYINECIAHLRGETVLPSVGFLQRIGKRAKWRVVVNSDGEWLFICGRDLFGKSIVSHNNPQPGDRVVVLNQHGECLGYGDVAAPLDEKRVVVRRLFDIGHLLRRGKKKRF
ncbi:hypothetical protein HY489_02115 [Candidatus Woesearchaeota archaeon]|nr:hypothetical protein [Candidatus Woesearchaeota archaeon]